MLNGTEERIREMLIDVASQKTTISYGRLNAQAPLHLDLKMSNDKVFLAHLLSVVSQYEHDQNRPLLAALVTNGTGSQKGKPDKTFFKLAQELGCYNSDTDPAEWLCAEQNRLYEQWQSGGVIH